MKNVLLGTETQQIRHFHLMVCTQTFIESSLRAYIPSQRTSSSWFPISVNGSSICPVPGVKLNRSTFWNANFQAQLFREPMRGFICVLICLFFSLCQITIFFLSPFISCLFLLPFSPTLSIHSLWRWRAYLETHLWDLLLWSGTEKFCFCLFFRQN